MRRYLAGIAALKARDSLWKSSRIKNMYSSTMNHDRMLNITLMVPPTTDHAPEAALLMISIHCCLLNSSLILFKSM